MNSQIGMSWDSVAGFNLDDVLRGKDPKIDQENGGTNDIEDWSDDGLWEIDHVSDPALNAYKFPLKNLHPRYDVSIKIIYGRKFEELSKPIQDSEIIVLPDGVVTPMQFGSGTSRFNLSCCYYGSSRGVKKIQGAP